MSGGGQTGGNLVGTVTDQVKKALEFDANAARSAAQQEWNPYFDEVLQDYLTSYNTGKTRSTEDLALQMADLNRQAPLVQEQIGGQSADAGLYFSGQRQEQQRLAQENFQRQQDRAQQVQARYTQDLETQKLQRERDLARQREQAVTGQVEKRRAEVYSGYA